MMCEYNFTEQLINGEENEIVLDEYYSQWYKIRKISRAAQKAGIDRIWTLLDEPHYRYSVEYKADSKAAETGHIFIETISVDTQNISGWVISSCAQLMIIYIPPHNIAYRIGAITLKNLYEKWADLYPTGSAPNNGYKTIGLLIPISEFATHCYKTDFIKRPDKG